MAAVCEINTRLERTVIDPLIAKACDEDSQEFFLLECWFYRVQVHGGRKQDKMTGLVSNTVGAYHIQRVIFSESRRREGNSSLKLRVC